MEDGPQTYGEKAVGVSFNPSGAYGVAELKGMFASIIDIMDAARRAASKSGDHEKMRLCSIAITEAQTAQMWAVKAVTWRG